LKISKTILLLFFSVVFETFGQRVFAQNNITISGSVTTEDGAALTAANIFITAKDSTRIIKFSTSDDSGKYQLSLSASELAQAGLMIKVQLLGYKYEIRKLTQLDRIYNFRLAQAAIELKDVIVVGGKPRVKMRGDTTTYAVKDFASEQDRTIGDVLKRLPGVTVEDNGLIKFNGKSVKKLYLDGDDLLDDKYNIGTRTIPQRLVNEVQVLENHQPIKALEDKVFSDDVDINLSFKKGAGLHVVGQVKGGIGAPKLYDEEANAISLKNSYKSINLLKLNNTGNRLSDDVLSLNEQKDQQNKGYTPDQQQLSAGTGSNPVLSPQRYLFNNSGLLNSANLWKLKSGMQVKAKAYYQYDRIEQRYKKLTNINTAQNAVSFLEEQNNTTLNQSIYGDVRILVNRADYYLSNILIFDYNHDKENSRLLANFDPLNQLYTATGKGVSNELNLMRSPKGNTLFEFYSFLTYRKAPERLLIDSNAYPAIFGSNQVFKTVRQNVEIPTFYTNNYVTIRLLGKRIKQSYKLGASAKIQQYNSLLEGINFSGQTTVPDSTANALQFNEYRAYAEPNYEWRSGDFRLEGKFPVYLQQLYFAQSGEKHQSTRVLFNPTVTFRYDPQHGFAGNIYYKRLNNAGNILQSYNGIVLNNYRSFSQNNQLLSTSNSNQLGVLLTYKNPVKLLFITLNSNIQHSDYNTIEFTTISKQLSFTDRILYTNFNSAINFSGDISKYVFALNSTISAGYSLQYGQNNQVINTIISPFINTVNAINAAATGKILKNLRYEYRFKFTTYKSKPKDQLNGIGVFNNSMAHNNLALEYNVNEYFYMKGIATNDFNNNAGSNVNYTFLDFSARYRLVKAKIDFQLDLNNITNIKNYQSVLLNANTQSTLDYPLRGRLILLKAFFIF
jgi:hypothetical protein